MLADKRIVETEMPLTYIKILGRGGILLVVITGVPEPPLDVTAFKWLGKG